MSIVGAGLVAFLLWLLSRGRAPAESTPPAGPAAGPGPQEPPLPTSARQTLERYRPILDQYAGPMPASALALIIWRETRGNPRAVAGGAGDRTWYEAGLTGLTVRQDGEGVAQRENVDPFDPRGAIYAAQVEYDRSLGIISRLLQDAGYPPATVASDRIRLMAAFYAIGPGALRFVLRDSRGLAHDTMLGLMAWLESPRSDIEHVEYGAQGAAKIKLRLRRAIALPADARALGPLPTTLHGLAPRGADVPPAPPDLFAVVQTAYQARGEA